METMALDDVFPDGRLRALNATCPTRQILDRISNKWTCLIMSALAGAGGTLRFGQVRATVEGISQKVLTQRLRDLERDGIVERRVYASVPPRVEYTLTPLGRSLIAVVNTVRLWAFDHIREIEVAQRRFDAVVSQEEGEADG